MATERPSKRMPTGWLAPLQRPPATRRSLICKSTSMRTPGTCFVLLPRGCTSFSRTSPTSFIRPSRQTLLTRFLWSSKRGPSSSSLKFGLTWGGTLGRAFEQE